MTRPRRAKAMDSAAVYAKFGKPYAASERTFRMGIDQRFTERIAERFHGRHVLETCTGGGFTTVALARVAAHVTTVEIARQHQTQARQNVEMAGLSPRVQFILGDILDEQTWARLPLVDAAFLDPDWAIDGPGHVPRFRHSSTRPPADLLLEKTLSVTGNVALILPPQVDVSEFEGLPPHERQTLFLQGNHELYCLYFGDLALTTGESILCA